MKDVFIETKEEEAASSLVSATVDKTCSDVISPEKFSCSSVDEKEPGAKILIL